MTWRARILGLVVALLGLGLAGTLALRWALAPERLAAWMGSAIGEASGLRLELQQPPTLRLLPRLAVDVGPGRLGEGAAPLLEWHRLRIDASAVSLLRRAPEFGVIEADGLHLRLRRDAAGRGNWAPPLEALRARAARAEGTGSVRIRGLVLRNARIEYVDERTAGTPLALGELALQAGAWSPGKPLALEGRFAVERAGQRLAVLSTAALRLVDAGSAGWRVKALVLRGGSRRPGLELPFEVLVPRLDVDLARNAAAAATANVAFGPARLALSGLRVALPSGAAPRAEGAFVLAEVAPRELLQAVGLAVPRTRDPGVLGRGTAQGRLAWDGAAWLVEPLELEIDDTRLEGRLRWGDALEFALRGTAIDLDRYREPADAVSEPFVFPGEAFAAWQARGTLTLARARVEGAELEDVTMRLLLDAGRGRESATEKSP